MSINKEELNELIDKLPKEDIPLIKNLVKRLIEKSEDSFIPYDDEPISSDDLKAIKESKEEFKKGETKNLKDVENELRS